LTIIYSSASSAPLAARWEVSPERSDLVSHSLLPDVSLSTPFSPPTAQPLLCSCLIIHIFHTHPPTSPSAPSPSLLSVHHKCCDVKCNRTQLRNLHPRGGTIPPRLTLLAPLAAGGSSRTVRVAFRDFATYAFPPSAPRLCALLHPRLRARLGWLSCRRLLLRRVPRWVIRWLRRCGREFR
jgi:hypothetical protein